MKNNEYLPRIKLPGNISASSSMREVVDDTDVVIIATPSKVIFDITQKLNKYITSKNLPRVPF